MIAKKIPASVVVLCVLAVGGTACGSTEESAVSEGDPQYVFAKVSELRDRHVLDVLEPTSFENALPNRKLVANTTKGQVRTSWSDVVVTGTVTNVQPGTAVIYPNTNPTSSANEEEVRMVDFDDPEAHERNVVVTIRPSWSSGASVGAEVRIRMGVIGGADPAKFLAGLRGLQGELVVALLDGRESGRHTGDFYPIMGGAMLGRVEADGKLRFSGMGDKESGFMCNIDTLNELRDAAAEPEQVITP